VGMKRAEKKRTRKRGEDYCVFERGRRRFALSVSLAREVTVGEEATPIPQASPHILGGATLQGLFVPLLQLDPWFDQPGRPYEIGDHILVVEVGDVRFGLVADRVRDIRRIDPGATTEKSDGAAGDWLVKSVWESSEGAVDVIDGKRLVEGAMNLRGKVPAWQFVEQVDPSELVKSEPMDELCLFDRGERALAVPVNTAREVLTGEVITSVPQAPAHLIGAVNLRGEILPLLRIDEWLDLPVCEFGAADQVLVVESGDVRIGILVDRVRDVRAVPKKDVQGLGAAGGLFRGYWASPEGLVTVLEPERLIEEAVSRTAERFRRGVVAPVRKPGGREAAAGES